MKIPNRLHNYLFTVYCLLFTKSGFSLIELLVSIAVIAMVMAVLFPNFMGFRQRARDTQRKSDLNQIQKALEMYKLDQNPQSYPTSFAALSCGSCFSSGGGCTGNVYMRKFPCDPGGAAPTYIYITVTGTPDSLKYFLSGCLENPADANSDAVANPICASTGVSYTVNEP